MHDIESRDQIIEDLSHRVDGLEAEVGRLKAHTWEQERKRVLRYLSNRAGHLKITDSCEGSRALERAERAIEKGEHWPEGGER